MKIYNCNEKKYQWFDKVNWKRVVLTFTISFAFLFLLFYFLVSVKTNMERAIATSLLISYMISFGMIIHYSIDNRINVYVVKDEKMYVIMPHKFSPEYDDSLISYKDFKRMTNSEEKIKNILSDPSKYIGIDIFWVGSINNLKSDNKGFKFVAIGKFLRWKTNGMIFATSNYLLESIESKKKFYIPFDYDKYKELLSLINTLK